MLGPTALCASETFWVAHTALGPDVGWMCSLGQGDRCLEGDNCGLGSFWLRGLWGQSWCCHCRLSGSWAAALCICPCCSFLVVQEHTSTRECPQGIPRHSQLWERALHGPLSSLLHFLSWESTDNHPIGHNTLLGAELGRARKENPVG